MQSLALARRVTGSFASPEGQAAATAALMADGGMLETPFSTAVLESPINAVVSRPNPNDPEVAVFHSGWGDGSYPTWLGRDDARQVILALTDFLLTDDPTVRRNRLLVRSPRSPTQHAPAAA